MAGDRRDSDSAGLLETYGLPLWFYPVFILLVILFGVSTEWDPNFAGEKVTPDGDDYLRVITPDSEYDGADYSMYMDASAMCVLGFGMLYTFSKFYVWGGVGLNFFICGFCFLWVNVAKTIVNAMWSGEWVKTQLNLGEMVTGCYITAAVLVSFGAIYGFTSPTQIMLLCIIEPFMMLINEHIVLYDIHVKDAGGSLVVHAFGAYFGIAVAIGMGIKASRLPSEHRTTTYFSDMGAMIGSVVLWMFWPSFNGATFASDPLLQGRIVLNTYLAIAASCATAFATSSLAHRGKFEMIEIQNSTLSGGVMIGMICPFHLEPWIPVLIGGLAGMISSMGYAKYHPFLEKFGITDSAAVQMLHGLPGVLGGVCAAFACLHGDFGYMYSYDTTWISTADMHRTRGQQFGYVGLAIVCTLGISIVSGIITGVLMQQPCCPRVHKKDMLVDHDFWNIHDHGSDPRGKKNGNVMANPMQEMKA
ncbi:hypothetical protein ACHWQZ_G018454 [Mnemiopsis leidyi]